MTMSNLNMFNSNSFNNVIKNLNKKNDIALKKIFGKKIKQNFLIDVLHKVKNLLGTEIFSYYDINVSLEKTIENNQDNMDYDICNHIVGLHNSNMIFLSKEEISSKQNSDSYKNQLVSEVIENIKLRNYGSSFFRNKQICNGENFLYYHLPYDIFVICIRINEILISTKNIDKTLYSFASEISNKGLSALVLLENNFLDDVYFICRKLIELYIRFLIIQNSEQAAKMFEEFSLIEIRKSACGMEYPKEFINKYNSRINKNANKTNFLHFGWVDKIENYHRIVKKNPYSMNGLFTYLKQTFKNNKELFNSLEFFYRLCHSYAHGNISGTKYNISKYFNISLILYSTISPIYNSLCEILELETKINSIDILSKIEKDLNLLNNQYQSKNEQNLEEYHKQKNLNY